MTNLQSAFSLVAKTFNQTKERAFSHSSLASVFDANRSDWQLPKGIGAQTFIDLLLKETKMTEVTLKSTNYDDLVRYVWGVETEPILLALSIKRGAYCSHGTAMLLHELGGDERAIFINSEQSDKDPPDSELTQEAIDRAFRNKQRISKLVYKYRNARITVLNGKYTSRLGVEELKTPLGGTVPATTLERTLVDITVRPVYAGGVPNVLEAFRRARGRMSIESLLRILKNLKHAYPYHQAIGYYMKRSGHSEDDQRLLKNMGTPFRFYLGHALKPLEFDTEFKVYFPKSLDRFDSRRQE